MTKQNTALSRRSLIQFGTLASATVFYPGSIFAQDNRSPIPSYLSQVNSSTQRGRWERLVRENERHTDVIYAVDFVLNQSTAGGQDLIIVCDKLTIEGEIKLPGRNLTLLARKIESNNGTIITAGADGEEHTTTPLPANALTSGTSGHIGRNGSPGGSVRLVAGELYGNLTLDTRGGQGGKGQTGGTGGVGEGGSRGRNATSRQRPGNGNPGSKGKTGGQGGTGGVGGDGGSISLVANISTESIVTLESAGGRPGEPGKRGDGGPGGPGGQPGDNTYQSLECDFDGFCSVATAWYKTPANQGPQGATGDKGELGLPGEAGIDGAQSVISFEFSEAARWAPLSQLKMALSVCKEYMINRNPTRAIPILIWIRDIADEQTAGGEFYRAREQRLGVSNLKPKRSEFEGITRQSALMLQRISSGLDPFGHSPSYVSHLSTAFISQTALNALDIAQKLQDSQQALLDEQLELDVRREALVSVLNDTEIRVQSALAQVEELRRMFPILESEISRLQVAEKALEARVIIAEEEFHRALERKAQCELKQMVSFAANVLAVGNAAYNSFNALSSAFAAANALGDDTNLIRGLRVAGETFNDKEGREHLQKMREALASAQNQLDDKGTRIVVSIDAFEQQLATMESMPEARRYRTLLREYVNTAQARNSKQVEFTRVAIESELHLSEISGARDEKQRVTSLLTSTSNPELSDCITFMTTALRDQKVRVLEILELMRRAVVYESLSPLSVPYRWDRVEQLYYAKGVLDDYYSKAVELKGRTEQPYEASFSLERESYPEVFEALERGDSATFSIPVNHPSFNRGGTSHVTFSSVSLDTSEFPDESSEITCRLTHQGVATSRDQAGLRETFSHPPRTIILSYKRKADGWRPTFNEVDNAGSSEERYQFLSPFAAWKLSFHRSGTNEFSQLDISQLNTLSLMFRARAIPANAALDAKLRATLSAF